MPPGGVTKKVHVKLTSCHIPLKRKFILIKEGKQLLMLKALGDNRSVYSIEERGVARRGITRSGKRHFQFSLPKFVNALEGMNNHNQHQNDHVTAKLPHSSIEASPTPNKSRKGHFARKSTGNNIKNTIQQFKEEQKKQKLATQDVQNCTKNVKLDSVADAANSNSTHKKLESSTQAENLKDPHQKSNREDQKDLKGPNVSTRASKQKQTLGSPSGKTEKNGEQQQAHSTNEKVVVAKSPKLEDKENVGKGENFNKDEKSCSFKKSTLLSGNTKAGLNPESKDNLKITASDKKIFFGSRQSHQDTESSLKNPSGMFDAKLENVTSKLHSELKAHPKQLSETVQKRERASTPTPESPGRKSIVNKLSRKRHRSASPKVCSSDVESNRDLVAKLHKEPIKLHSKNYEKVKNACKNAISQRKDKTTNKVDVENAESEEAVCSKISPNFKEQSVSDQSRTQSVKDQQSLPDKHQPASKKAKLSLTGNVKLNDSHKETAKSPVESSKTSASHPHTDSDDGLARLMKDFQSAIVASTTQKSIHGAAPKHKYISKKTSQHAVVAKSQKNSFHMQTERREDSKKSVSFKPSHNLKILVPIPTEPVSSDEECEHPAYDADSKPSDCGLSNVTEKHSGKDSQNLQKGQQCTDAVTPIKVPELTTPSTSSPDKLVVVDQIGFLATEDSNNSSKRLHNVSESQKTSSDKPLECSSLPHGSGGADQLSEEGIVLGDGQICSSITDKAQELDKTAIGKKNIISDNDTLKNGYKDGILNGSKTTEDSLQHIGQKDSQRSNLKREYERVTQQGDGKKPKICHEETCMTLESHYTQTDEVVISKEDKAIGTEVSGKSDVKNQATQFDGEPRDLDTEEISRIVAAMYESECEEKERLVQALQVQKEREDKWRKIAQDCAKQLQELKDKIECKGKETREQGTNTSEGSSSTALPVIISSQSTQTERIPTNPTPIVIPTEEKTISSTPVVPSKPGVVPLEEKKDLPKSVLPSATATDKVEIVTPSATKTNTVNERRLPVGPSTTTRVSQEISKQTCPVQNVSKNQTPARTLSAPSGNTKIQNESSPSKSIQQNGIVKHAASDKNAKAEALKDVTVIDLTDTEDVNNSESTTSTPTKRPPVQSRSTVLPGKMVQGSPINLRKSPGIPSKANIIQLTSKTGTKEQSVENKVKPLTSPSGLPPDYTSVVSKRSQSSSSSSLVQGMQRVMQTKPVQNSGTMKVSANLPVNQLVTIGQPIVAVPPPRFQVAQSIAGNIYSPQSAQVPVFSTIGNIGMIIGNQPQPRQEGAMQGVLQTHGIMQRPLLTQGQTNILNQKAILEKRQQELQQQLTQCYQRSNNKKVTEISVQLQAVMTELRNINDRLNAPAQGQRNMRVTQVSAPPNVATQATRLPVAPQYNIATGTVPPVSTVHQLNPAIQQREVNGVKSYVPHATLNTTLANAPNKSAGKTWFPETRQVAEITEKQGKGNKFVQHINQPARSLGHPAKLPVLQHPPVSSSNPLLPPPSIRITHSPEGVVLSWNINVKEDHPTVKKYFLYAYQVLNTPPSTSHWKRIGEVGALAPPMACTLNQFQPGSTYFLAICAVDVYDRPGIFSKMEEVVIPT